METTACPECDELAEVQWRAVLDSTDGPVEHAKILCVRRHWFLLPVAQMGQGARGPRPGWATASGDAVRARARASRGRVRPD
jgi:hypothetical protein